jgi:hypothetical protein
MPHSAALCEWFLRDLFLVIGTFQKRPSPRRRGPAFHKEPAIRTRGDTLRCVVCVNGDFLHWK